MKRSEFIKDMTARYVRAGRDHWQSERQAIFDANRNQREGIVTWDPEETEVEVLWEAPEFRSEGPHGPAWTFPMRFSWDRGWETHRCGEWCQVTPIPLQEELARRILAERNGEAGDGHLRAAIERQAETIRVLEKEASGWENAHAAETTRRVQVEQQLSAQKQIEETLRAEIRALGHSLQEKVSFISWQNRKLEKLEMFAVEVRAAAKGLTA
jgi:hypothetical protein